MKRTERSRRLGWSALTAAVMVATVVGLSPPSATASSMPMPIRPALPGTGAAWPQFQRTPDHRGLNPFEQSIDTSNVRQLALSWVGQVPGSLNWASPVVANGSAYIAAGDAGLAVFPADGCGAETCQPSWTGQTGPQAIATPAVWNGFAFVNSQASFTSNDGRLNVFDAEGCGAATCSPVWQGVGGDESFLVSSPAVAGGMAFVGSYDGKLYAFDANGCAAATCQPLWSGTAGTHVNSSPALADGVVYVGSTDGLLSAFDANGCGASTCAPLWTGKAGRSIDIASPTVAGGVVLVSGGNAVVAFDANGCGAEVCEPLWSGPAELMSNTPAVADGIVYVDAQPILQGGRSVGVISAFDLHGCGATRCPPLWRGINFTTGSESSPVVANGVVYIGKGPANFLDSGVFSYDAAGCGHPLCLPLGFARAGHREFFLSSTPAVLDGRVYLGSTESVSNQAGLYVFELPS